MQEHATATITEIPTPLEGSDLNAALSPVPATAANAVMEKGEDALPGQSLAIPQEEVIFSEKWVTFARSIRFSRCIPTQLRSTSEYDSTFDILMYLAAAKSYGLEIPAALFQRSLYLMELPDGSLSLGLWAQTMVAIATSHGCRVRAWYDPTKMAAICSVTRNGETFEGVFSVEEAAIAGKMYFDPESNTYKGVVSKNGKGTAWSQYWPTMLIRRATSRACQMACADLLMGVASADEFADSTGPSVAPTITIHTDAKLETPVQKPISLKKKEA